MQRIEAAYNKKDWLSVKNLTHKLKGGVSYCGAPRLKEACAQLESAIRDEKNEVYEDLYKQLLDDILDDILLTETAMKKIVSAHH